MITLSFTTSEQTFPRQLWKRVKKTWGKGIPASSFLVVKGQAAARTHAWQMAFQRVFMNHLGCIQWAQPTFTTNSVSYLRRETEEQANCSVPFPKTITLETRFRLRSYKQDMNTELNCVRSQTIPGALISLQHMWLSLIFPPFQTCTNWKKKMVSRHPNMAETLTGDKKITGKHYFFPKENKDLNYKTFSRKCSFAKRSNRPLQGCCYNKPLIIGFF